MNLKKYGCFLMFLSLIVSSHGGEMMAKDIEYKNINEMDKRMRLALARREAICKFLLVDMLPRTEIHPLYLKGSEFSMSGDLHRFNAHDCMGIVHCAPYSQNTTYIGVRKNKAYLLIIDYPGEYLSYFDREQKKCSSRSILEGKLEDLVSSSLLQTSDGDSSKEVLSVDWWKRGMDAAILKKPEQLSALAAEYFVFLEERNSDPLLKKIECVLPSKLYESLFQLFQKLKKRDDNNPKIPDSGIDVFLESIDFLCAEYGMDFYELVWNGKSFCFTLGYRNYDEAPLPFYIDMLCESLNVYIQYNGNGMMRYASEYCMFEIINKIDEILKDEPYGEDSL